MHRLISFILLTAVLLLSGSAAVTSSNLPVSKTNSVNVIAQRLDAKGVPLYTIRRHYDMRASPIMTSNRDLLNHGGCCSSKGGWNVEVVVVNGGGGFTYASRMEFCWDYFGAQGANLFRCPNTPSHWFSSAYPDPMYDYWPAVDYPAQPPSHFYFDQFWFRSAQTRWSYNSGFYDLQAGFICTYVESGSKYCNPRDWKFPRIAIWGNANGEYDWAVDSG